MLSDTPDCKSQQDVGQRFRAVPGGAAMSLSPPKHDAVSSPGVFCWEVNAISLVARATPALGCWDL